MSQLIDVENKRDMAPQRGEKLSKALSHYARNIAFENRSRRNLYRLAGLAPRRRDQVFSILIWFSVIITLVLPFLASIFYYLVLMTPQYESEVKFVVRSAAPLLSGDRFSTNNAEPKQKIIQDTQIIVSYLGSMATIDDLRSQIDLRQIYGRDDIDFLSRLESDSSREDLLDFWEEMHDVWINPKSGIVDFKVRAFTPKEARQVLQVAMKLAEQRVNRLNSGIWDSLEASAKRDLAYATQKLEDIRIKIRNHQQKSGVLDVDQSAENLSQIVANLEVALTRDKVERKVLAASVSRNAPHLRELERRIAAQERELQKLKEREATTNGGNRESLASISKDSRQLDLQLDIAEKRFSDAVGEFEKTKLLKSLQLVYLDQFTEATLPQDYKYPNEPLAILLSFIVCLIVCGVSLGVITMLRRRFD